MPTENKDRDNLLALQAEFIHHPSLETHLANLCQVIRNLERRLALLESRMNA